MPPDTSASFEPFERKMKKQVGLAPAQIANFRKSFEELVQGSSGAIPESDIEPATELPDLDTLAPADDSPHLDRAVVIKLNGGLGTSMGLDGPKGALRVKGDLSFLDIVAQQILTLREQTGAGLPLVLMNSFNTSQESLSILSRHPGLEGEIPLEFLQSKVPKIDAETMKPARWPKDPELEWCPPGHGDLYPSLGVSGLLQRLLNGGFRYAFVSNIDNTGAVLDPKILHWFAESQAPFLMEVTDRTPVDRKGGHLARTPQGQFVLREVAQCPERDLASFQDINRHRFFNTNNLWINLETIAAELEKQGGFLPLPLIVNRKNLDPRDASSPQVLQLESAMGAAIAVLPGAQALRVSRQRFAPVKTSSDLLAVRSDAYALDGRHRLSLAQGRREPPAVVLDPRFYKMLGDFEARFPEGPPSLAACERLEVEGDIIFPAGVVAKGRVAVSNPHSDPRSLPTGELEGSLRL